MRKAVKTRIEDVGGIVLELRGGAISKACPQCGHPITMAANMCRPCDRKRKSGKSWKRSMTISDAAKVLGMSKGGVSSIISKLGWSAVEQRISATKESRP